MVLQLDGPVLRIDKLIQDLLKSEWPTTADIDINKLQTTVDKIDWGHNYNEHTNFRATIKVVSVSMSKSTQFKTMHKLSYDGSVDVRVQYRDVGNEQPQEIWNIGHELKNIIVRNPNTLQPQRILDIQLDDFNLEEESEGILELQAYHQELKVKILQTIVNV
jgi:hypothetical protein